MPHALIIGASRGLGRALVEEHLQRGWSVLATVRDRASLADLRHEGLEIETLDTTDWAAVDALRERLEGRRFDLMFVNAGVSGPTDQPIAKVAPDEFVRVMLVNALAPVRLLDRYAGLLAADGMMAAMSSELGSIGGNRGAGWETYRMSKAALNMGLRSLGVRYGQGRRTVLAVHPGWVQTDMGGPQAPLTIEQSVPQIADVLEQRRGTGGMAYVAFDGRELAW